MKKYHHQPGYTLIEIVVVLVIFSLLAGLALPRLTTMYDSVQTAYERDEVLARLGGLGYLAFQQGLDFELISYPPEQLALSPTENFPLELPKGWEVRTETPIHFFANGVCSGGEVYLIYQGREFSSVQLEPPFCSVIRSTKRTLNNFQ